MRVDWLALDALDAAAWEALLAADAGATPFHTLGWARATATLPGVTVRAAVVRDGARYAGGALVAERRAGPVLKRSAGVYGAYGSPLVAGDDANATREALVEALCSGLGHAGSLELADFGGAVALHRPGAVRLDAHTRLLDLSGGYDSALRGAEITVRQKLRQAARAGVTVDARDNDDARAAFLRLAGDTYARHDSAPPPAAFYDTVMRLLVPRGEARLALARTAEGDIAGAAVHLLGGGHVFNWLTCADPAHAAARPAMVLIDDALRWGAEGGARLYNFGATPAGSVGVEAFKKSWGSEPHAYAIWRLRTAGFRLLAALRGGSA